MRPAEVSLGRTQPELEGLGGDRTEAVQHVVPLRALSRQLGAGVAGHPRWDGEDDEIEVRALAQDPALGIRPPAPVRLERVTLDPVGIGELVDPRGGREAGQSPGDDQRIVGRPRCGEMGLSTHGDGRDPPAVLRRVESVHTVEELELTPRFCSASNSGAKTMSPMPAAIFQKIAPL